jgi:phosphinothricin acetyltransferase
MFPMRQASTADAASICKIYNHYVESSTITFEDTPVSVAEMAERIFDITNGSLPWLVEEANGNIVGYAYASKWKSRAAYQYAAETTIYLAPNVHGLGIGTKLYKELLRQLKERSMHVAIGGIALQNDASVRLHEKLGYQKVAEFIEVGFKFNKWINVGYWEVKL